ncbi:MAG TPA: MATE family efflux transporter [Gemmatimonadaceae bacterium]|nr:MATE family efflux transporter [Gemmatimonadaceae bacterium]
MTDTAKARLADEATPAALPIEPRDGLTPVAVTGEYLAVPILVQGPLASTILRVALPAVGSTFLLIFFISADAFWVGRSIGPTGLAAVSTSIFWVWAIVSLSEMVSVGITAVAARRHGERRRDLAARAVGDAIVYTVALSLLVTLFGRLFLRQMFGVEHTSPDVTALGMRYLGTYLWGASLVFCFFTVDASFRASGDTRTPLALLFVSVLAALALDPVLIMGLGPAPRLGIAGAAVSMILTRFVTTVVGITLLARRGLVRFGRPSWHNIASITKVGLPTALTGIIFSLVYVLLTRTTTEFGVPAVAALGVGHRVESWTFTVAIGFGAAAAAVVGQNLGARRVDRARRAGWIATGFVTAIGIVGASLEYLCAVPFARIFTSDPAVIAEGARYLRIGALSTLFAGAEVVLEGALGGAGDTLPPMITSTTLTVLRIPLAAWAADTWGAPGIWWVLSITALGRGLAMTALWKWRNWAARAL